MTAALWWATPLMADRYSGSVIDRVWSLSALVSLGMVVFFAAAYVFGAFDRELLSQLRRRRPARTMADDEIIEVK